MDATQGATQVDFLLPHLGFGHQPYFYFSNDQAWAVERVLGAQQSLVVETIRPSDGRVFLDMLTEWLENQGLLVCMTDTTWQSRASREVATTIRTMSELLRAILRTIDVEASKRLTNPLTLEIFFAAIDMEWYVEVSQRPRFVLIDGIDLLLNNLAKSELEVWCLGVFLRRCAAQPTPIQFVCTNTGRFRPPGELLDTLGQWPRLVLDRREILR